MSNNLDKPKPTDKEDKAANIAKSDKPAKQDGQDKSE